MNKTKIDWADYTVNPVKGKCPMKCSFCYARRIYERFHWDTRIRYDIKAWKGIEKVPAGSRIFVGSMMELFGEWVDQQWLREIFKYVYEFNDLTFIFLTKRPEELVSYNPWPANAWVGATATDKFTLDYSLKSLRCVDAPVRFVSIEPLLGDTEIILFPKWLNWVIVGAQTGPHSVKPPLAWVSAICEVCWWYDIPIFLKDNLLRQFPETDLYPRKEYPII